MIQYFYPSRNRGFTFLEMLVVTAVFSGILVATTGVFIAVLRSQVGSYYVELEEQANMRAAFELENAFHSSLGFELDGVQTDGRANTLFLRVPHPITGVTHLWEFSFVPGGVDSQGRITGSFSVVPPDFSDGFSSSRYFFSEEVWLPFESQGLFELDDYGRISYDWRGQGADGELRWKGLLSVNQ